MNERTQAIVAAAVGAVAGGLAGYMLFTRNGRELRRRMEPAIEDLARELMQLRGTVTRALNVASEGWQVFNEALGERREGTLSQPRQTSPF